MAYRLEINPNIVEMEYAVRGPIPLRAAELQAQGRRTIPCNIGNPQALGQAPITYYRQVLSLLENPRLIERERRLRRGEAGDVGGDLLPGEVIDVASRMLEGFGSGQTGAYTESRGPRFIREAVAAFIDRRDGAGGEPVVKSDPDKIFLTNGASDGAKQIIEMLIAAPTDGIMIPIPQYPLYSATIRKCGGVQVDYFPDEERDWALDRAALEDAYSRAADAGVRVKAIVAINPGNPTGAILDESSVNEVIDFAADHDLIVIADEVYQENLYGAEFHSFAKVLGARRVPVFSLHSVSKGFYGECGHRGGYLEVRNPPEVSDSGKGLTFMDILLKQVSVSLCSNTIGQALTFLMVTPPPTGTASSELFLAERRTVLAELAEKARLIREAFESMKGVRCFGRTGAMYLFPRLDILPAGTSDFDYCMALLEETGLCTVNGSGFGQAPGTHHLRIAFLPPREMLEEVLPRWIEFHNDYVTRS
jgi:aspartate/methionine/tyrosine aminotransferase